MPKENLSFEEKYPHIIEKYYDYDNNDALDLDGVSYKSNRKANWNCKKCGTSWIAKFQDMAEGKRCPNCETVKFKSFPEQCLYYYVHNYFESATWGCHLFKDKGLHELDIYIPELNTAVEYDGEHWHQEIKKDMQKDLLCDSLQIKLFRIREPNCPLYSSNSIKVYRKINNCADDYQDLNQTIYDLLNKIDNTKSYNIDVGADITNIYNITPQQKIDNSFGENFPDLATFWDFQNNGNITPWQISPKSDKIFSFLCQVCEKTFKRSIASITRNSGCYCNICARKAAGISRSTAPKEKSLGKLYPDLAKELENSRNGNINIFSIYPGSQNKLWWECSKCGYLYEMTPNNRTNGHGCSQCSVSSRVSKRSKKVKNKKSGEIFNSITEASKVYKIAPSCICEACNGRQKTAAGCQWEYTEDI